MNTATSRVSNNSTCENDINTKVKISSKFTLKGKVCKFCSVEGHGMTHCPTYTGFDERVNRCVELHLCSYCASAKHSAEECSAQNQPLSYKCVFCSSRKHISPLCPDQAK